jgi:hypothetical protein
LKVQLRLYIPDGLSSVSRNIGFRQSPLEQGLKPLVPLFHLDVETPFLIFEPGKQSL